MEELSNVEQTAIKKISINTLKEHYIKKYEVHELNNIIKALQKMGMRNKDIAAKIGIREDMLYYITPIDHATAKTTKLIREGRIDGYKASRLLRSIGNDERQNEFMDTIINENTSTPKAEQWISEQKNMDDEIWCKEKIRKEFQEWLLEGFKILTKNRIEITIKEKEKIKIIIANLNRILGNGI